MKRKLLLVALGFFLMTTPVCVHIGRDDSDQCEYIGLR